MQIDKIIHFDNKPRSEVKQKPQTKYHKVGCLKHCNGYTLFSFNIRTHEWKVADIVKTACVNFDRTVSKERKVTIEKDCIYIEALNLKNAKKTLTQTI